MQPDSIALSDAVDYVLPALLALCTLVIVIVSFQKQPRINDHDILGDGDSKTIEGMDDREPS
jgi:hypothetical protein